MDTYLQVLREYYTTPEYVRMLTYGTAMLSAILLNGKGLKVLLRFAKDNRYMVARNAIVGWAAGWLFSMTLLSAALYFACGPLEASVFLCTTVVVYHAIRRIGLNLLAVLEKEVPSKKKKCVQ
jgi:hypothetical protein